MDTLGFRGCEKQVVVVVVAVVASIHCVVLAHIDTFHIRY
jgi:hypothetical protein